MSGTYAHGPARARPAGALVELRLRTLRNRFRQQRRQHKTRLVVRGGIVAVTGLWLGFSVLAATIMAMRGAAADDEAAAILATLLALVVLGGFIGTASAALQSFYLAPDLPYLLSLPLPLRVTFTAKLLDAMVGLSPVAVILVASLVGYGVARSERWWFLVAAPAIGMLLLIATSAFGVLVVAAIGRLLPPRRAGLVLGVLSLALVALLWAAFAAVAPDAAADEGASQDTNALGLALAGAGEGLDWTPVAWAARALVASAEGSPADAAVNALLVAGTAAGLVGAAFAVFAATFARAYGGYRLAALTPRRPDRPLGRWVASLLAPLPKPVAALILKEWLTMVRDLRRLSGAVWPLGMVAVYTVLLSREDAVAPVGAPGLAFWLSCGTLALVPWGASLGVSIYAFGTERHQIHLLRTLPIAPRTLLLAKVLASLVPVLALATAASVVVASVQGATGGQFLGLLGLVAWASLGYVTIDTAASAIAPNFAADQVQRTTALAGRILGFAAGAVFTVASGAAAIRLIFYGTGIPADLRPLLGWEALGVQPLGWPLVVGAAAVAALDVALFAGIALDRVGAIIRDGE